MPALTTRPKETATTSEVRKKSSIPKWAATAVFAALAIFLTINGILWWRCGDNVSTNMWNGTGSIDVAVNRYAQLQAKPHVVLLGSSLVMYPFWAMDKEIDPKIDDIFHHRQSLALSSLLKQKGLPNSDVYSFAIFGQMISDAYLYVNEFMKGSKAPDYIVFGIAPRDFHDNDLAAPMATYSFKRLINLDNFFNYASLYLPTFENKLDWLMGRACYFFSHRWRMQHDVMRSVGKVYTAVGIQGGEAERPTTQAGFMMQGREDVRFNNSLNEYKRRYSGIDGKDLELQFSFLQKLLDVSRARNIKVIVVNMPLTEPNRNLMPPGFYKTYSARVNQMVTAGGAKFVDLGASSEFVHDDFWDTTHLNHQGGHKLIRHIEPLIN